MQVRILPLKKKKKICKHKRSYMYMVKYNIYFFWTNIFPTRFIWRFCTFLYVTGWVAVINYTFYGIFKLSNSMKLKSMYTFTITLYVTNGSTVGIWPVQSLSLWETNTSLIKYGFVVRKDVQCKPWIIFHICMCTVSKIINTCMDIIIFFVAKMDINHMY